MEIKFKMAPAKWLSILSQAGQATIAEPLLRTKLVKARETS